jgi:hypothetical protein
VIVLVIALVFVGITSVAAFGGLTALLRDDGSDRGSERLFGDSVTTTVVLAAGAVVVGLAALALLVLGLAGLRS